jgi:hypothetical protein
MVAVRLSQQEQLYHCHGRATNATATGTLNVNNCTPDCANGTNVQYPIQMSASNPQHCNVAVYKQYSSVSQQKKAYVFNKIQLKALSGNPPSYLMGSTQTLPPVCGPCLHLLPLQQHHRHLRLPALLRLR